MRITITAAIFLAALLTFTASSLIYNSVSAQTGCAGTTINMSTVTGSWSSDCFSNNRSKSYARFYTFSLAETTDVTITLESDTDPYLFLLNDSDAIVAENDDIDTNARNYNSRISQSLDAGEYTIEATTYGSEAVGAFTITISGIDFETTDATPTSEPSPTPTSELPACVDPLPDDMTVDDGTWNTECTSSIEAPGGSGDRYARFYTFTLDAESDVTIDLNSDEDTYLYLRSGISTDGTVDHENDDITPGNYDSQIEERLDAGSYTVEATTYNAGVTGSFTLTVAVVPVSDTTDPEPPDMPDPPPDPAPDPTTLIPEGCTLQSFSGTSEDGSWTSDCVSQNRTENGTHYAKFFSFSVSRSATYDITLVSRTDPYLILLDDTGDVIDSDDDDDDGLFNLGSRNSGIRIALDPGDYIVEATTYAGSATGAFTLTITRPELAALQALYNSTDGANWTNNDNWLSDAPLSDWHGIETDDEGRVTEIYLIGNGLDGEIPAELGNLTELEGLYLARNELSGSIPSELGSLSSLNTLMLFNNELTGTIPYQLGNLDSLEVMHLSNNQLSGRIPTALGNLENLRRLHLTVNDLEGRIPSELGDLSNLRQLSIASNDLTGSIPDGIADLSELTHIYLWGNDLSAGTFVSNLDKLTNLQWLDIGGNRHRRQTMCSPKLTR